MVDLIEAPDHPGVPVTIGEATLEVCPVEQATWLAVLPGKAGAVSTALKGMRGVAFPEPDRAENSGDIRAIWTGPDEALVFGDVPEIKGAVTTDMSDGIAVLRICGGAAREVLMRLTPLDIRDAAFEVGATARTQLGHMNVSLIRTDEDIFEIIVMRSMTHTAIHELTRAMKALA